MRQDPRAAAQAGLQLSSDDLAPQTAIRMHLQGMFLLIVILVLFWWLLGWAVPVLDGALFGADGAIVARAPTEVDDPASAGLASQEDEPLDGNEVAEMQGALLAVGYSPGPIDGIMGELTRQAIDEAKGYLGLANASDRELLDTLRAALGVLEPSASADGSGP